MAWKIERWLSEVFPGEERIYIEYRDLRRRELAVVAAGVLDLALAELLSMRLIDKPGEYEEFLGLNEDGRAPCSSFGARIQLALLLGIITNEDATILRLVKKIRNKFSHRIKVDFTSDQVKPLTVSLYDRFRARVKGLVDERNISESSIADLRPYLDIMPEAGAGLLLAVFTVYQAYFHRLSALVERVGEVKASGRVPMWQQS